MHTTPGDFVKIQALIQQVEVGVEFLLSKPPEMPMLCHPGGEVTQEKRNCLLTFFSASVSDYFALLGAGTSQLYPQTVIKLFSSIVVVKIGVSEGNMRASQHLSFYHLGDFNLGQLSCH